MLINETPPSSIPIGRAEERNYTSEELKSIFTKIISKKDPALFDVYNRNIIKNSNALKTFFSRLEDFAKTKCEDDNKRQSLKVIFNVINQQLLLIDYLNLKEIKSDEVLVILLSTFLDYIDNFLVDKK
jgi:hypothetical protein